MTITGEQIIAYRKQTKASRKSMSEATGLSEAKIANLEKGRAFKGDEEAKMLALIGPWLETGGGGGAVPDPGAPEGVAAPAHTAAAASSDVIIEPHEDDLENWTSFNADDDGEQLTLPEGEPVDVAIGDVITVPGPDGVPETVTVAEVTIVDDVTDLAVKPLPDLNSLRPPNTLDDGFVEDGIKRISNGELRTFKRCRRKWWLAYYRKLGLRVEERTGVRAIGTRIHMALASWYVPEGTERGDPTAVLEATIQQDMEALADDPTALAELVKDADLCRAMLEGYFEWLAETGADEGITITASETKLEVDAQIPNVRLIAKLDVRARRDLDGAMLFVDHKTTGSLTEPVRTLHMDEQMLHYHLVEFLDLLAAGHQEERTVGVLYNMLRKVKRTARATPPFFDRVEVHHNMDTLRSYWLRVKGTVDEILELEQKLEAGIDHRQVAYPTPMSECTWSCDYFHLCSMMDDGSRAEDFIAANYVTVNPLKRYETTDREVTH